MITKRHYACPTRHFLSVAFALLMLAGCSTRPAEQANCVDTCINNFHCDVDDAEQKNLCQSEHAICVQQCEGNRDQTGAPAQPAIYGAIAYDKNSDAWGVSDRSQDESSAEESALKYCSQHGSGCEIVESFSKTCAAVASGAGHRLAWAIADNSHQAGQDAINKCGELRKGNNHSRCSLQLYNCYFP